MRATGSLPAGVEADPNDAVLDPHRQRGPAVVIDGRHPAGIAIEDDVRAGSAIDTGLADLQFVERGDPVIRRLVGRGHRFTPATRSASAETDKASRETVRRAPPDRCSSQP